MTEERAAVKRPFPIDLDCDHCGLQGECRGDLSCCVIANGCEPWLNAAPSAHVSLDTRSQKRTTTQVIHEQGRTWLAITVEHAFTASRLQGGRTYWTFEFSGVLEELPDFELHAPGVCDRCTRRWRGLEMEAAA